MKQIKIILLIIFVQLASCQSKMEPGFVLEKKKLYYNGKEIALGMPIEKFTDAMGMYDRIDIDSSGGFTNRTWHWKKEKYRAFFNNDEKKYIIFLNNENLIRFETMEELTSKYGKFDSIEETKSPLRISKFFIWDELGVSLSEASGTNIIGNIFIQTLHITKYYKLDLGLVKSDEERYGGLPTKETANRRENDIAIFERSPKKEYTGNFTYNGKTINLKKTGYKGWEKAIDGLGLNNSDYNPPGDSPQWSRWIRQSSDLYVTFERFSNMDEYKWGEPSREDTGDLDCIQNIVIWWHRTNDKTN